MREDEVKYICNVESFFVNMRTDFKIGDTRNPNISAPFSKIKTTEGTYERAKQKVEYAKRKYISACKRATRLIQKRDQNLHLTNGTVNSKAVWSKMDQALREVKSEQMQYVVFEREAREFQSFHSFTCQSCHLKYKNYHS